MTETIPAFPDLTGHNAPHCVPTNEQTRLGAWIEAGSFTASPTYRDHWRRTGDIDADGDNVRVNFYAKLNRKNAWSAVWRRMSPQDMAACLSTGQREALRAIAAWEQETPATDERGFENYVPYHRHARRRLARRGCCARTMLEVLCQAGLCEGFCFSSRGLTPFGRAVLAWL